jgi:hypothetical protein
MRLNSAPAAGQTGKSVDGSPVKAQTATPTLHAMPLKSEGAVVPGILISDVSIVEHGTGKRSIVGCFDQFIFPQFPATYGRFWVTIWISNLVGTLSELNFTCRIQQQGTGHVIFSNAGTLKFPAEQTFERSGVFAAAMMVQGAVFPQPGTYTIVILLNDQEVGSRDFLVILPQQPKQQLQEPT